MSARRIILRQILFLSAIRKSSVMACNAIFKKCFCRILNILSLCRLNSTTGRVIYTQGCSPDSFLKSFLIFSDIVKQSGIISQRFPGFNRKGFSQGCCPQQVAAKRLLVRIRKRINITLLILSIIRTQIIFFDMSNEFYQILSPSRIYMYSKSYNMIIAHLKEISIL